MTTALIERIFLKFHPPGEESVVEKPELSPRDYLEKTRDPHGSISGVEKSPLVIFTTLLSRSQISSSRKVSYGSKTSKLASAVRLASSLSISTQSSLSLLRSTASSLSFSASMASQRLSL